MLPQSEKAVFVVIAAVLVRVTGGDDLIKEVRSLLVKGQVAELVNDQSRGLGVDLEFADQRMIDLSSEQMIEHIHGRSEQDADVRLASAPAEDLSQEGFSHARI